MHFSALTLPEQRVLGCLIEKRYTTPDQYPLSINALRLACNQSTNRDPVVAYDDHTVNEAAQRLCRYELARLASGHSSRAVKYRHLAEETLGVDKPQLSLLCVLLLRGPQTPGELKTRTERMCSFSSLEAVEATLGALQAKGHVVPLPRRPGQKEGRWGHTLGGDPVEDVPAPGPAHQASPVEERPRPSAALAPAAPAPADPGLVERVAALEAEVAQLRAQLADLLG